MYGSTSKVSKAEPAYVIKAALENGLSNVPSSIVRGYSSRYGVSICGCPRHHTDNNWCATVALQDAYSYSFKFVYYCMLASGLVAFAYSFILLPNVDADLTSLVAKKLAGIESEEVMAEGKDIEDVQVEHTGEK